MVLAKNPSPSPPTSRTEKKNSQPRQIYCKLDEKLSIGRIYPVEIESREFDKPDGLSAVFREVGRDREGSQLIRGSSVRFKLEWACQQLDKL